MEHAQRDSGSVSIDLAAEQAATRPIVRRAPALVDAALAVLFLGIAAVCFTAALFGDEGTSGQFQLIVASFAVYLYVECRRYVARSDALGLLAPPLLATIAYFYLAHALPSAATLWDPWILDRFARYFSTPADELSQAIVFAGLAAFCMWRGYDLGRISTPALRARLARSLLLRREFEPHLPVVLGLQGLYVLLVAFAVSRGLFGMASTAELRQANVAILDLVNIGMAGGTLSLLVLAITVFKRRAAGDPATTLALICAAGVALQLLVGAISGFKSQLVMPFLVLALAQLIATRRLAIGYIVAGCLALIVAYQVIEPYRAYLHRNSAGGESSVGALVDAFGRSQEQRFMIQEKDIPLSSMMISRFDLTGMTAVGLTFADRDAMATEKGRELAESILLSPILAFVPRLVWSDKPSYATGVWFSQQVLGSYEDDVTSVGMGPITFLYMAGGILGVVLGFTFLGWVQAVLFDGVARSGAGGMIIFLSAVQTLIFIPTDVGPSWAGLFKMLPIAFIAQLLLLRADHRGRSDR